MKFHKSSLFALIGCSLVAFTLGECPNACSGHGTCGQNDECSCDYNWMAADCSERVCPFGLSFVDTPRGDLNHNGRVDDPSSNPVPVMFANKPQWEQFPSGGANVPASNEAHFYAECSNRGICDRELGVCECFDGYTGSSCQRTVCPNDCSGHGVCRTVAEVAGGRDASTGLNYRKTDSVAGENFYSGVTEGFEYRLWDADKHQTCVCDPGYTGPDCSLRECPRGDDPLTYRRKDCGGSTCTNEIQDVVFNCLDTTSNGGDDCQAKFALQFKEWTGMVWRTDYFTAKIVSGEETNIKNTLEQALEAIPNSAVEDVSVTCTGTNPAGNEHVVTCEVTFDSNPGNLDLMTLLVHPSMIDPTGASQSDDNTINEVSKVRLGAGFSEVVANTDGNTEESVCSNRGLCDYETGLCQCFRGYYHDDCSRQNALAGGAGEA